jgi:hypothetical protein
MTARGTRNERRYARLFDSRNVVEEPRRASPAERRPKNQS